MSPARFHPDWGRCRTVSRYGLLGREVCRGPGRSRKGQGRCSGCREEGDWWPKTRCVCAWVGRMSREGSFWNCVRVRGRDPGPVETAPVSGRAQWAQRTADRAPVLGYVWRLWAPGSVPSFLPFSVKQEARPSPVRLDITPSFSALDGHRRSACPGLGGAGGVHPLACPQVPDDRAPSHQPCSPWQLFCTVTFSDISDSFSVL